MNTGFTWFANQLIIVGLYCTSPRRRWPFLFIAAGEAIYVAAGMAGGQADLAFICTVFCVLAIRNFRKWGVEP